MTGSNESVPWWSARSRSTAIWLRVVSSRARRRRLVMSLNECTRKPISSRDGSRHDHMELVTAMRLAHLELTKAVVEELFAGDAWRASQQLLAHATAAPRLKLTAGNA